jgi:hypothetical protein
MHALIFVLVPHDTPDIPAEVERLMAGSLAAPEKLFPLYCRECYCVGSQARTAAFEQVDASPQGIVWKTELTQARKSGNVAAEQKIVEERAKEADRMERLHPLHHLPDSECNTCQGTGQWTLTRDPADVYDWWSIGGRWDFRDLDDEEAEEDENEVSDEEYLARNCLAVRQLLREPLYPAAIISPEGFLYEADLCVSFALVRDANIEQKEQDWEETVRKIWMDNLDYLAVIVDGHF